MLTTQTDELDGSREELSQQGIDSQAVVAALTARVEELDGTARRAQSARKTVERT